MLQTDRKTEQDRQAAPDREQTARKQNRDAPAEAALALEAILNGGSLEQLPAEGMLALSHRMGNGALAAVLRHRGAGPDEGAAALPGGSCLTEPGEWDAGEPLLAEAPDFASFSPMGAAAPMEV
jgi:hypothetical protein